MNTGIIGQQRYSATHCGLHPSTPRHLRWAIPAAVRSGLFFFVFLPE